MARTGRPPYGRSALLTTRRERWERLATLVQVFREREGHTEIPATHVEDGEPIGRWWQEQRQRVHRADQSARANLSEIERLRALGIDDGGYGPRRARALAALDRYVAAHGDTHVPRRYVDPDDGFRIGSAVVRWRRQRREGTLPVDLERALDSRGMAWEGIEGGRPPRRGTPVTDADREALTRAARSGQPEDVARVASALVDQGVTYRSIGEALGVSQATASRLARTARDRAQHDR